MPTATRGAAGLILLGALLAQAPLAAAYEPLDLSTSTTSSEPSALPSGSSSTPATAGTEAPMARSWRDVVQQVTQTSPDNSMLRTTTLADQSQRVMRCFRLETENYCLGLGFVDKVPTGAQISATATAPSFATDRDAGTEQDIATGAMSPADFVAERSAMADGVRLTAELNEMETAWAGREKAHTLRELDAGQSAQPALPASSSIMKGFQTSQEKGYWCGPATFQSIDWADDQQKDTQASWAKDLGATTSGTAISAMVKQTNLKTNWDVAAGTYIVQNVGHWNSQKFFTVHQNHLGDSKPAPVIEHTQLLKRYFPYLAFNHSGHYQVGRGYDKKKGTIAIFEVFNERRFNSRGNLTDGPKNIPASALFNATLANAFKNIGL